MTERDGIDDDLTAPSDRLRVNGSGNVRVLYIAGIGRSGSTLLCRTLGHVRGFVGTGELMRLLGRGVNNGDLCSCSAPVRECELWRATLVDLERRCPDLDLDRIERTRQRVTEGWEFLRYLFLPIERSGFGRDLDDYRRFLSALYRSIRSVTGARVIVDASKNLFFAKLLIETPGVAVNILHLVRDSRGVAHSLMKRQLRPGTNGRHEHFRQVGPLLGSILWSSAHLMTEWLGTRTPLVARVRYEEFVSRPADTVARVLEQLGPMHGSTGTPHVNGRSVHLGFDHLIASNPNRSARGEIELSEDTAWRREMSVTRQWLVTGMTAPLLRRYGYRISPREHGARNRPVRITLGQPEP